MRARETLRLDLMRARHRLSKLLLRRGIQFDEGRAWTERHRAWLKTVDLEWPAAQATLLDAQESIEALCHRREQLEREIVAILPSSPWSREVGRLRCLRGVDTLTAVGLCAEVGDFERFARAEQLMSARRSEEVDQRKRSSAICAVSERVAILNPSDRRDSRRMPRIHTDPGSSLICVRARAAHRIFGHRSPQR